MMLSDSDIQQALKEGRIVINPLDSSALQPTSVDIRLGSNFQTFRRTNHTAIDPFNLDEDLWDETNLLSTEPFILHPGEFALGTTVERIELRDSIVAQLQGKSSLGRLGLIIHATAGFIDPGFCGEITLELTNFSPLPLMLWSRMKIGHLSFARTISPVERPYGSPGLHSKYQDQKGATPSRFDLNKDNDEDPET